MNLPSFSGIVAHCWRAFRSHLHSAAGSQWFVLSMIGTREGRAGRVWGVMRGMGRCLRGGVHGKGGGTVVSELQMLLESRLHEHRNPTG